MISQQKSLQVLILGAGITGLTSALALRQHLPDPKPRITIYEIRPTPSTIGGAVSLTPKALRYLDHLGVYRKFEEKGIGAECKAIEIFDLYSGKKATAELDFRGPDGDGIGMAENKKFVSRRVMRWQIQECLLERVNETEGIEVVFGKKVAQILEPDNDKAIYLTYEDGSSVSGDILLGCDGIHSAARSLLVEAERKPTYTGMSVVMATCKLQPGGHPLRWETTGVITSRKGSLMTSCFEPTRTEQYLAGVMEVEEVDSREGWRIKGSDQKAIKADILDRFQRDAIPEAGEMIRNAGEWTLYPVYALPPHGKWVSPNGRCILLGDSSHAMPPQGESTGICIEDAVVFSRCLLHHPHHPLKSIFAAYEALRRAHIDAAHVAASRRWETIKDNGWLAYQLKWLFTSWFLWWTAKGRDQEFAEDWWGLDVEVKE